MVHKLERASSSSFIVGLSAYMINHLLSPIRRKLIGLKYQPPVTCRVPPPPRAGKAQGVLCKAKVPGSCPYADSMPATGRSAIEIGGDGFNTGVARRRQR